MADLGTHLVITPDQLADILHEHLGGDAARPIHEQIMDASIRTEVIDGHVIPPVVNVLGAIAEQLGRVADAAQKPRPTLTEEFVIESWEQTVGPFYQEKALPFLGKLQVDVEIEPTRRL